MEKKELIEKYSDDVVFETLVLVVSKHNESPDMRVMQSDDPLQALVGYEILDAESTDTVKYFCFRIEELKDSQFVKDFELPYKPCNGRAWISDYLNTRGRSHSRFEYESTEKQRKGLDLVFEAAPDPLFL